MIENFSIGARNIRLFLPPAPPRALIVLHGEGKELARCEAVAAEGAAIAAITGVDWNGELSPWPAPKAFARGEDFSGGAPTYLQEFVERILPAVEAHLPEAPTVRAIAGYSLAGLFALYAAWHSECFNRVASMSGSLWYDGFVEHLNSTEPIGGLEKCYLSLGEREAKGRNPRMNTVEACTRVAAARMEALEIPVKLVMQPGGHFQDVEERVEMGLREMV